MAKEKILIIGDWKPGISSIEKFLVQAGFSSQTKPLNQAKEAIVSLSPDLVMLCYPADQLKNSYQLILDIRQIDDSLPLFMISDNQYWEPAVDLIKLGISEYLNLPFDEEKTKQLVSDQLRFYKMTQKIYNMGPDEKLKTRFEGMVGASPQMQENFKMIQAVSKSNVTVLITGESGTGKELVAKAIHRQSNRAPHRFVDLNCGAIPRELLENELFGHEKGAFTGAHKRYSGSFEVANRGTLFLDEISEMEALLQVKLLRVLQERSFMRIAGTEKIDVDVRIIAATNRNLEESIQKGDFREDLFYRLNVVNIAIPSLRERREDIPLLSRHFLEYYTTKNDRIFLDFANDAMEALINYDWPGNVRELENTIERVVVLNNDSQVKLKHLSKQIQKVNRVISFADVSRDTEEESRVIPLEDVERKAIELALLKYHGNVSVAAKKLKIGQATLYRKIKTYGLQQ